MKFKKLRYIVSFALCLSFFSAYITHYYTPKADASTLEDLQNAASSLAEKIRANESRLSGLKSDINKQEEYLETLQANINYTQNQLDNLNNQIDVIKRQISEVEATVANLEKELDQLNNDIDYTDDKIKEAEDNLKKAYEDLSSRLKSAYITGNGSNLKLLLGSDNIATFLRRLELMKLVSENDAKLINDFKAEAQVLELSRSSLEERTGLLAEKKQTIKEENQYLYTKRSDLTSKKAALEETSKSLEDQYSEVQNVISKLDKNSTYYRNLIAKQQREMEENENAIAEILEREGSKSGDNSDIQSESTFMFPLKYPGVHVTSGYGNRSASISGWSFHGGVDFSAHNIYGQPIYASKSGKVIRAEKYSNSGYGHYVIIDHGDSYFTVYGHCSEVLVDYQQYVKQGQIIARVGSTGNSTGPHLHFEIRKGTEKKNPLNYVRVP